MELIIKMEKWKKVKLWPYEVSCLGRVRSRPKYVNAYLMRGTTTVLTKRLLPGKILKLTSNKKNQYLQIIFKDKGRLQSFLVHRLVLSAFVPIKTHMHVNHKNLIKTDNRLENLEWCTRSENMMHASANGRLHTPKKLAFYKRGTPATARGELSSNAKLTNKDVLRIKFLLKKDSGANIAREYKVSPMLISLIKNNKLWSHVI